jgi:NADH-quinone oxidoreductase subunit G
MNPERQEVTLVVDGVEIRALEGSMLVDAAQEGDVEIPVFCYEPKLGQPVGACRMCLVEVEGIPKLQTACSTPVRDGMVVYTQTDRVIEAQNAVVEFLLVNHPLDCPVCDKGGECPLQDIAMGWGPGRSRFTDPKRHFQKPLPLSPLIRIDRERCILCYRCVRFSQEISEDEQLMLLDRADRTYVGTFDDRPYIAPFHGNIIELCPVGALTSEEYRFRARPWDVEVAGTICTLCPSQCNIQPTVRDERVMRVLARDNMEVDDGWLCDKGRFGYQMRESPERITRPMLRRGGELRPVGWGEAIEAAAAGLLEAGERTAAVVGGWSSNEEGYLVQRILREALGSPNVDSRRGGGSAARGVLVGLSDPRLAAAVSDLDRAETILVLGCDPLHEMPILDLRIRKATRRHHSALLVASERPTALDGGADASVRYWPGDAAELIAALAAALAGEPGSGPYAEEAGELAAAIGDDSKLVVVWSERIGRGEEGGAALEALGALAAALRLGEREGSGLIAVPEETNGRGLREVGCLPDAGPGFAEAPAGRGSEAIREGLESGELGAALLVHVDPVRDHPDGPGWERALQAADFVVSVAMFEDASTRHADVVFPAEAQAEKDGTVTHPDGRLQRVRQAVPHPGEVRHGWQVLVELSAALAHELDLHTLPDVFAALSAEVPFYAEIRIEELGGQGLRWQETDAASALPESGATAKGAKRRLAARSKGKVRLGTYRDLWSGEVTERNPALRFLAPKQTLEIAPADAARLRLAHGAPVSVRSNGSAIDATVAIRERLRPGAGFLIEGTRVANANALRAGDPIEIRPAAAEGE